MKLKIKTLWRDFYQNVVKPWWNNRTNTGHW